MVSGFCLLISQTVIELKNTAISQTFENMRIFSISISSIVKNYADNWIGHTQYHDKEWIENVDDFFKDIALENPKFRISLIAKDGSIIGDSDAENPLDIENQIEKEEVVKAFSGERATAIRESSIADLVLLYYAIPLELDGETYVLRLSMPKNTSVYFTTNIKNTLILTGAVILCFVLLFTSIICYNVIKGLKELETASKEYKNGNLDYVPEIESTREINDLAKSFVIMAKAIKDDKDGQ